MTQQCQPPFASTYNHQFQLQVNKQKMMIRQHNPSPSIFSNNALNYGCTLTSYIIGLGLEVMAIPIGAILLF